MKAKEFDQKFDEAEDITQVLDLSKAKRPLSAQKRVSGDSAIELPKENRGFQTKN